MFFGATWNLHISVTSVGVSRMLPKSSYCLKIVFVNFYYFSIIMNNVRVSLDSLKLIYPFSSTEFLNIYATTECGFTPKRAPTMIKTYSQMHCTDKYSKHSSIIWRVLLNGWVIVYELSGCGFECGCYHILFHLNIFVVLEIFKLLFFVFLRKVSLLGNFVT